MFSCVVRFGVYLHVSLSRTGDEEVLRWVHGQSFDGRIMCLKCVKQLSLTDIKDTHETFPAARDDQLLFRSVLKNRRSVLMALERCK